MPGLDYLQAYDPRDDNYFRSGIPQLALDWGLMTGVAWWSRREANKIDPRGPLSKYSMMNTGKRSIFAQKPTGLDTYAGVSKMRSAAAEAGSLAANKKSLTKFANNLGRANKFFTLAGAAILAYDLSRSLGLRNAFTESRRDAELAMRRPIYQGDDSYFDSRAAFTQRQRAIQTIHNSQLSMRAAMGQESQFLHN